MRVYFVSRKFWTDLAERSVSTIAQSALGVVTASAFGILELDSWETVGAVALTAGLVSVLKAFALGRPGDATTGEAK